MKTWIVLVNIWNSDYTDTFQGTTEVKASSKDEAIEIAEKMKDVNYASDAWEK